jgi:hypothetical protein
MNSYLLLFVVVLMMAAIYAQAGSLRGELSTKLEASNSLPYVFSGEAPFCGGSDDSCPKNARYGHYHGSKYSDLPAKYQAGFGAKCVFGEKYLCFYDYVWVGTAPVCNPKPADCPTRWGATFQGEGHLEGKGSSCMGSNGKLLCTPPHDFVW